MILAAAAAHRIFVDHAQAGSSLARIENARSSSGHGFDKFARQGGDAAHALQKIQDDPFTRKNHPRIMSDHRYGLPFMQAHAIENLRMRRDFIVGSDRAVERRIYIENSRDAADAGENAVLLRDDGGGGTL